MKNKLPLTYAFLWVLLTELNQIVYFLIILMTMEIWTIVRLLIKCFNGQLIEACHQDSQL